MATQPAHRLTPDEYLALDRAAETRSEYIDGRLLVRDGAPASHVLIMVNIVSELGLQLKSTPVRIYSAAMRVHVAEGGMYAYPDVVVVNGPSEFADEAYDVLLNPTLIVEVISPSTEAFDRGLKAARYRQCASLQEYLLVAQDRVSVERYTRHGEQWTLTEVANIDERIELPSIGCTLALRDVYLKVEGLG
jgi:Uma2 family endonuclease